MDLIKRRGSGTLISTTDAAIQQIPYTIVQFLLFGFLNRLWSNTCVNSSTLSTPSATQAANKQALLRREDNALLRGQGKFGHDIQLPHLQYVAFVRSTQAHATINGIHTADALQVPGVLQIFTAADLGVLHLPHINPLLPLMQDTAFPVLAMHEVAYVGQPIAVVVANNRHAARLAAGLVEVDLQT